MATKPIRRRPALQALVLVAMLLLLGAGASLAHARGGAHLGKTHLGKARALNPVKCPRSAKRVKLTRRRARCVPRNASASQSAGPIYWGATIGDQVTGMQAPWDMDAVTAFEGMAGRSASLVNFFQPFADCGRSPCSFYPFPDGALQLIRDHGSIPVLTWASQSTPSSLNEPEFQLADVAGGAYDGYLTKFAQEAKEWGHPFFLRFNWEMNGNWFPWSEGVNGNGAGAYVAAWRHVHDIFAAAGATNATWVWCPNVDPAGTMQDLSSLYPGDDYVDWTGLDGYNWGTNPASPKGWRSFDQLYRDTYDEIVAEIAPSKPMMIGEMGATEHGGSKAAWIEDALARIPAEYPQIRAVLWFDKLDDGMDWPIESSQSSIAAFARGIQNPVYVGNSYGNLSGGLIPVAH